MKSSFGPLTELETWIIGTLVIELLEQCYTFPKMADVCDVIRVVWLKLATIMLI